MNHLIDTKVIRTITHLADDAVALLVLGAILAVVLAIGFQIAKLFTHLPEGEVTTVLHMVAVIVVLVKAYRLLIFYMENQHVSIKYVVEISIIAPAVELIFAPTNRGLDLNILYAVFSVVSLLAYLHFYQRLQGMDEACVADQEKLARAVNKH
ncbi:hypothetical protein CL628_01685 [bacterium]|nr:hypothetical protein [bacterium]